MPGVKKTRLLSSPIGPTSPLHADPAPGDSSGGSSNGGGGLFASGACFSMTTRQLAPPASRRGPSAGFVYAAGPARAQQHPRSEAAP